MGTGKAITVLLTTKLWLRLLIAFYHRSCIVITGKCKEGRHYLFLSSGTSLCLQR